jgi:N-acetylneuraminic acid mutarotase
MSKSVALLLVLVFLSASCLMVAKPAFSSADVAEDSWVSKAPMQEARGSLGVAVVNGKIYAIGGSTYHRKWPVTNGFVGTNEEYDPVTDTWTFKKPMPIPKYGFAIAVYQNKIYCIGGVTGYSTSTGRSITGANHVYDPETDTWETKASMPTARWLLQANVVNGKIYLIGGQNGGSYTGVNEVYDPLTDSWTTKAPMPTAAQSYASAVVDNKIYVVGGFSKAPLFWSNLNQIYNPETDKWHLGTPAPSSVSDGAAGATSGVIAPKRIYVMGVKSYNGLGSPPCLNRVYDPEKDIWAASADVPTNRLNFGAAVVNDKLYAIGGCVYNVLGFVAPSAVNEQYTPIGYGTVPPAVHVISPENKTYNETSVPLTFSIDEPASRISYGLDGQDNVTIAGNTTISELSNGSHNLTVYVTDQFGNTGVSETVYFTVDKEPEPFPTIWIIVAAAAIVATGGAVLVYFVKARKTIKKGE